MQFNACCEARASSTTFEVRLHLALGTASPMYAHSRMWSCVLHDRHTGLAAAAVPGLNGLCSVLSGYWSTTTSMTLRSPVRARYCQPSFGTKRPPNARSTTYWSSSANVCERGKLCSRVNPFGVISMSNAGLGDGPIACFFSKRAVRCQSICAYELYWFAWQPPQVARSVFVAGRFDASERCSAVPSWQVLQPTALCLPLP